MLQDNRGARALNVGGMAGSLRPWWQRQGWRYHPFEYLDAARDPHLLEYIVVPQQVGRLVCEGESVLVLAPPGGGKTALRRYLEQHALKMGGSIPPLTVIPALPPTSSANAERMAVEALARRLFWQAVHLFDRVIAWHRQKDVRRFLYILWRQYLRLDLKLVSLWLESAYWEALETLLGPAYQPYPEPTTLRQLAQVLRALAKEMPDIQLSIRQAWHEGLALLKEWDARQVWLLLDGLDGFPETATFSGLWSFWKDTLARWLTLTNEPLPVILKAFLPATTEQDAIVGRYADWPWQSLQWKDEDFYELLAARLRAATGGLADSWDPWVTPSLRPFASRLLETLPHGRRWPREWVVRSKEVLACLESSGQNRVSVEVWHQCQWKKREQNP